MKKYLLIFGIIIAFSSCNKKEEAQPVVKEEVPQKNGRSKRVRDV